MGMSDDEFEAMLREVLAAETEVIQPSPDSLECIRARLGSPRRWYAHAAEVVFSLMLAAAIVGVLTWIVAQIFLMILHSYAR
jgi:hypothetical protein